MKLSLSKNFARKLLPGFLKTNVLLILSSFAAVGTTILVLAMPALVDTTHKVHSPLRGKVYSPSPVALPSIVLTDTLPPRSGGQMTQMSAVRGQRSGHETPNETVPTVATPLVLYHPPPHPGYTRHVTGNSHS